MKTWIYLPVGSPALQVSGAGVTSGIEITPECLAELRSTSVCVGIHEEYSTSSKITEGIAHYGFKAPSDDGVYRSRPDAWVCIVPAP